jgi:hypothetical protein
LRCPGQDCGRGRGSNLRPLGCKRGGQHRTRHLPATTVPDRATGVARRHPVHRQFAPRLAPRATWLAAAALAP